MLHLSSLTTIPENMNKTVFCTVVCWFMLHVPVYGQHGDVFGDSIVEAYYKAFELNESKDYLQAYRQIVQTERAVDRVMSGNQVKVSELSEREFLYVYWPVKKSRAETAYMLGLHTDMKAVSDELRAALDTRQWENEDVEAVRGIVGGLRADIAKIDGCRYYLARQYDSSEAALLDALRFSPRYGNDAFVNKVHDDLAQLYYKLEDYGKSLAHLDSILSSPLYSDAVSRNKETKQNIMLVKSQRALCLARLGRFKEAVAVIEPIVLEYKKLQDKRLYAEALRKKAKILMLEYDATGKYKPLAKSCYQEYLAVSKDYIDEQFVRMDESEREQYWMAEQPFLTDCYRLEDKAPELLYDVALYSKALLLQMGRAFAAPASVGEKRRSLAAIRTDWRKLKASMPAASAAIEFIAYDKAGANRIGALVLNKTSASPVFVEIGRVDSILSIPLTEGMTAGEAIASDEPADKNPLYGSKFLSERIWNEKMLNAIGNARNVYFAPDGLLHLLAVEYLLPETLRGRNVCRLTTTRRLTGRHTGVRTDSMLACGGVDYKTSQPSANTDDVNDNIAYANMSAVAPGLPYLNGSKAEVDSLRAIRGENHNDTLLCASNASESALRTLMGKYHIVHIATHGYFTEAATAETDIRPLASDEQLSKNCLFLSGAERNLHNPEFNPVSLDGILSARELAEMNLSQTDLMVLSACQTGLGFVTPDGVAGLQRGLKAAGVKALVVSLWKVDDQATAILMKALISNLDKGMDLTEAFREARQHLMETVTERRYKRRGELPDIIVKKKYDKPQYHDAFILIDGH